MSRSWRRPRAPADSALLLSLIFIVAGLLHFLLPAAYVSIVPPWLPAPLLLVYISGVAEVVGGLGLLIDRTRRLAGIGLILLLLAVWPANIRALLDARASDAPATTLLLLLLRIPLQLLLIWWVWRASRRTGPDVPHPQSL